MCTCNIKRDIVVKKIRVKYHFKIRHFRNNNYFAKCNKSLDGEEIRLLFDASFDSILYIVIKDNRLFLKRPLITVVYP